MIKRMTIMGAIVIGGCATAGAEPVNESAAAKLAEFDRTGEVTSCLNVTQVASIEAVDEKTLLIRSGVSNYYVSDLSSRCSGATRGSTRFEYTTSTSQLCRNQIVRIVDMAAGLWSGPAAWVHSKSLPRNPQPSSRLHLVRRQARIPRHAPENRSVQR